MKYVIPVCILVVIVALLYFLFPARSLAEKIVADMVKKQNELIIDNYNMAIADANKKIEQLSLDVKASDRKINSLKNKIGGLENEIAKNKKPEDSIELRNRFCALGIVPVGYECPR